MADDRRAARAERAKKRRKRKGRPERPSEPQPAKPPPDPAALRAQAVMQDLAYKRRLALAATISLLGLALVSIRESLLGATVLCVGLVGLMAAIHLYGRLGIDAPAH